MVRVKQISDLVAPAGARVTRLASFVVPNNIPTAISFDTARWNQGGVFSLATPTRLTAPVAGVYQIGAKTDFDSTNFTGTRTLFIRRNGNVTVGGVSWAATAGKDIETHTTAYLNAGDYVEAMAWQNSGTSLVIFALPEYTPEFWIQKIDGLIPSAVFAETYQTYNNANYSIPSGTSHVDQVGTVTGRRTLTLPPAPNPRNAPIAITDSTLSSLKYGTIVAPSGADTINGKNASIILSPDYATTLFYPRLGGWVAAGMPWPQSAMDGNAHDAVFSNFTQGLTGFTTAVAGGSVGNLATNDVSRLGILELTTGTGTTGRSALTSITESISFQSSRNYLYKTAVQIPVASDSTNPYTVRIGFNNSASGDGSNGIYFRYSHALNGGIWQCVSRAGGIESVVNTLTGPSIGGSYQDLTIWVNAQLQQAEFFINNVLVATINTNIPVNAGNRLTTLAMSIVKDGAGSTNRSFRTDYVYFRSY